MAQRIGPLPVAILRRLRWVYEDGDETPPENQAPTDITLSASSVTENASVGSLVATISGTDPEGQALTFSKFADPDGKFTVSGNQLLLAAALDYEAKTAHSVTIRATDTQGATYDEAFTITVTDVVEVSPFAGHRYYRYYITGNGGSPDHTITGELVLRSVAGGGTNHALGKTVTASTSFNYASLFGQNNLTDGNNGTAWATGPGTPVNQWAFIDLGPNPPTIVEFGIRTRGDTLEASTMPQAFRLESSDALENGVGTSWQTRATVPAAGFTGQAEFKTWATAQ